MIPEQQLIQNMVELLDNGDLERTPVLEEFAEQYAELCQDIVTRLQRCAEYMDRGMRSEAVHEATSPPALLELVDIVRFPELRKWGNLVVDLGLAAFPQVPMEIVERLRQECATEEGLAPLLKEYRRLVYQGDRANSIRVLRELRQRDPGNPSWPQNLRPLEEAALPGLLHEVDEALATADLARLQRLYQDLIHPQRTASAPAEVLTRVKDALLAERRASSRLRGTEVAQRIRAALAADDQAAVAAALAAWDALSTDEAFAPDERATAAVAEGRAAHETWERQNAAAAAFRADLSEVQGLLRQGRVSIKDIEARLERLRQTGMAIPEGLQREVDEAQAAMAVRRRRRARALGLAAGVLGALVVTGAALALWRMGVQRGRRSWLTEMTAMLEAKEYERLQATLDVLKTRDPSFYGSGDVRHLVSAAADALSRKAEAQRRFADVMAQLDRLREAGYAASGEQIQGLLAEARQVSQDESADRAVSAWQSAWEDWQRRRRVAADDELARATALVRRVLDERRLHPFAAFADEDKALARVEPVLRDAKPLVPTAGTEAANAFNAVCVEVEGWRREFDQRRGAARQAEEHLASLREQIDKALPDLARYRGLVEQFVREFPAAAESAAYQRVLSHSDAWIKAEALCAFALPRLPPGPEVEKRVRDLLGSEAVRGSAWEADLKACVTYLDLNEATRQRLPMLTVTKDDSLRLLVSYYKPVGTETWRPLYHPKPLMSRKETDVQGEFVMYWGLVYASEADDQVPVLIHTSKAFPAGFSTRQYDVRLESRPQDNLVPHGRFLYGFVAEAVDVPELDVYLLNGVQSVLGDPGLEPVPRAWLLKRLVSLLHETFADSVPESLAMLEMVRDLDTDVPWMNPRHPKVLEADRRIAEVLRDFPPVAPIVSRLQVNRALLAASLSRQVRCVGWMKRGKGDALVPFFPSVAAGAVWVLSVANPGVPPTFKVAGSRSADGALVLKPGMDREVFEGQILFAPGDGHATRDLLETIVPRELRGEVRRPGCWPTNEWVVN